MGSRHDEDTGALAGADVGADGGKVPAGDIPAGTPDSAAVEDGGAKGPTRTRTTLTIALRVAASVGAVLVGVGAWLERDWLDGRTFWLVVLAVLVAAPLLWSERCYRHPDDGPYRVRAALAACAAAAGGLLAATGLGRDAGTVAERLLDDDVPPPGVYAVALGFGLCAVASVVVAVTWRRHGNGAQCVGRDRPRIAWMRHRASNDSSVRPHRRGVLIGALSVVMLAPLAVGVVQLARGWVDEWAESAVLARDVTRPIPQLAAADVGPENPRRELWRAEAEPGTAAVPVPGWDTVLLFDRGETVRIRAVSPRDGSRQWTYTREAAADIPSDDDAILTLRPVAIDPEAGRILLVASTGGNVLDRQDVALVLSLEDGTETATEPLPDGLRCNTPVTDTYSGEGSTSYGRAPVVGPDAVMLCSDYHDPDVQAGLDDEYEDHFTTRAVFDVGDGRVRTTAPVPGPTCSYAAAPAGSTTYILQWGPEPPCEQPTLHAVGPDGDVQPVAEIDAPAESDADVDGCPSCVGGLARDTPVLRTSEDTVVLSLDWEVRAHAEDVSEAEDVGETVALDPAGELRWRRRAGIETVPVLASDRVVAYSRRDRDLRLLDLTDGSELAAAEVRCRFADGPVTTDGERVYVGCNRYADAGPDGVEPTPAYDVYRVDDLELLGDGAFHGFDGYHWRHGPGTSPSHGVLLAELVDDAGSVRWAAFGDSERG